MFRVYKLRGLHIFFLIWECHILLCNIRFKAESGSFISCISSTSYKCLMVRVSAAEKAVQNPQLKQPQKTSV